MNSMENVFTHLVQCKKDDSIEISLSDNKELITIKLSPLKYILATDDMVEIRDRKKVWKVAYWASKHWHPDSFDDLYEGLMRHILSTD